jgi:2-succinyl-6-hydroxy-2,4-cyclohexadiene-1-carboxylate synthase
MGGRLAMAFSSAFPKRLHKLYLESSSYGEKNNLKREQRYKDDMDMSKKITNNYSDFIVKWSKNPLFVKQKDRNIKAYLSQKEDRLSHNPTQLSKSLSSFSTGLMEFYLDDIHKISSNVTILNGAEDKKFVKMGLEMSALNKNIKHCIVPNCGHNIHIENLDYFIDVLTSKEKNDNYR